MLMLSLHRLRLRLLLVGGKSLSGQEREGPTVTDMMASYHRLLSAALQVRKDTCVCVNAFM